MLNILFTTENGPTKGIYFPAAAIAILGKLGTVTYNEGQEPLSEAQLSQMIAGMDVCITHWGCPQFSEPILARADRLRLIAHAAGSVGDLVTPGVYARGIRVCSANPIMAKYVAESVLAYILAGLKQLPQQAEDMKIHKLWRGRQDLKSLYQAHIGLVGLGTIGKFLLDLLQPFHVEIKIYDPYVSSAVLAGYPHVTLAPLEEVLAWGEVISIHTSLTSETRGMLDADRLALIRDGALLVNTARGPIVDELALIRELQSGRLNAVLDVYSTEPLPPESPLRQLNNVITFPHTAGNTERGVEMTYAILEEIERFARGEALQYEIPFDQFKLMTREREFKIYN